MTSFSDDVNEIQQQVAVGSIDRNSGALKILACLYENNILFYKFKMDSDSQHDFFLNMYPTLCKLFVYYEPAKSSFATYLFTVLDLNARSFLRRKAKAYTNQLSYSRLYTEEHIESTLEDEEPLYDNRSDNGNSVQNDNTNITSPYAERSKYPFSSRQYSRKERILILAMKSAYYLTPTHVKRLAQETGYSEELLWHYKVELEKKMHSKIEVKEKAVFLRNSDYYKKNKLEYEMLAVRSDSYLYPQLKKSYAYYYKRWMKRIKNHLQDMRVVPSNKAIADILNISENRIHRILQKSLKQTVFKNETGGTEFENSL